MDSRTLQGWHTDPFGRHELRYFSAGNPTKLVRDGAVEAYDEPPAPTRAYHDRAPLVHRPPTHADRPALRRRTGLVYSAVALVAVAAVVAFVAIEGGFHPASRSHAGSAGEELAAFVKRSATQTLAQKTADFTLNGMIDVGGTEVDMHGNGQADFAANALAMNLSASYSGMTIAVSEIVTSTDLYQELTVGSQSMAQYLGGRHWFAVPLPARPAQNVLQDSPVGNLQMLEQQGSRVVPMGTQDIGGRNCSEYVVTPSTQAMLAAAQQEWAKMGLSSSAEATARDALNNLTPPTITVWLDPQRQLTCQLDVSMQFSVGALTGAGSAPSTESAQMLLTFTHYGAPVTITPPAQSDTVTF